MVDSLYQVVQEVQDFFHQHSVSSTSATGSLQTQKRLKMQSEMMFNNSVESSIHMFQFPTFRVAFFRIQSDTPLGTQNWILEDHKHWKKETGRVGYLPVVVQKKQSRDTQRWWNTTVDGSEILLTSWAW